MTSINIHDVEKLEIGVPDCIDGIRVVRMKITTKYDIFRISLFSVENAELKPVFLNDSYP